MTIDERNGSFPAMLQNRIFNFIMLSNDKAVGKNTVAATDKVIGYAEKKIIVKF